MPAASAVRAVASAPTTVPAPAPVVPRAQAVPAAKVVPPATVDAVRAHPLVRQAMEIFDATSMRVRAKAPAQPERGLVEAASDDAEPAPMIDAPAGTEGNA